MRPGSCRRMGNGDGRPEAHAQEGQVRCREQAAHVPTAIQPWAAPVECGPVAAQVALRRAHERDERKDRGEHHTELGDHLCTGERGGRGTEVRRDGAEWPVRQPTARDEFPLERNARCRQCEEEQEEAHGRASEHGQKRALASRRPAATRRRSPQDRLSDLGRSRGRQHVLILEGIERRGLLRPGARIRIP